MQSTEYSDLTFVEPNSWTPGRYNNRKPQLIVIHTTEGHEGFTAAEDGAAYDARRTDGTSTHYFHDPNSTIQCVLTKDTAHHARTHGNRIGIGHEHCGTAGQTVQQWDDSNSNAILRRGAKQAARDAKKWGFSLTDIRRLSTAEVRAAYYSNANLKGFCGHVDITYAFPEDEGTHTDPGKNFPWNEYLQLVRVEFIGGFLAMLTDAEQKEILNTVRKLDDVSWSTTARAAALMQGKPAVYWISGETAARNEPNAVATDLTTIKANLQTLLGKDFVDEAAVADAVFSKLHGVSTSERVELLRSVLSEEEIAELKEAL